jgi:hypothetical protein
LDPQRIIEICEGSWDAHKSDCSGFVKAVTGALGVSTFAPDDDADSIVDKLGAAGDWIALPSGNGSAAKAQADTGLLVVAGLKGAGQVPPVPHGHVVVVVTGPLDPTHGKYPTAYWGRLGGLGAKAETINYAWQAADRDQVGYFAKSLG